MQTAIAPRSTAGPLSPGASQPGASQPGSGSEAAIRDHAGREESGRDDAGRDAFASFMVDAPPDSEPPADGAVLATVMVESPVPVAIFWPALTAGPGQAADAVPTAVLAPAGGQPVLGDLPLADGLATPPNLSAALALGAQAVAVADPRLPSGVPLPPAMTHLAPQPVDPGLALPALPLPAPVPEGQPAAISAADMARPSTALPGAPLPAAGLRFWQAAPQPGADAVTVPDPQADPDALSTLTSPPEADRPAVTNFSPSTAAAPPSMFVAKLAETALQSLFAAQAEAAAQDPGDPGGLGATPLSASTLPGAGASVAIQATTLPNLATQLVQTLAQRPDGTTEIALSPDELGHVRVTLQADAQNPDRIIVMLSFERPETLDLFRRHADQLAEALRDAGFSGADIGFGRSEGGENRDARSDPPPDPLATDASPADLPTGPAHHHPALRLAATGTLDLRL